MINVGLREKKAGQMILICSKEIFFKLTNSRREQHPRTGYTHDDCALKEGKLEIP